MAKMSQIRLNNVLESLCLDGKDYLIARLQASGSLKAARLAFKALRNAVDDSVRELHVKVRREDAELVASGSSFPLQRWSRLRRLDFKLWNGMALPLMGNPSSCVSQLTELTLSGTTGARDVALVLYRMPNLVRLNLNVDLKNEPLQQLILHDAFESLSRLEELVLEWGVVVPAVAAVADRLRRLEVWTQPATPDIEASCQWLATHIHAFRALESVCLDFFGPPAFVDRLMPQLMRDLPAGVRQVRLWFGHQECQRWDIVRDGGNVTELHLTDDADVCPLQPPEIVRWVNRLLPRGLDAYQPPLRLLTIDGLALLGMEDSTYHGLQQLGALAQICQEIRLGGLRISTFCNMEVVLSVQQVLGTPERLVIVDDNPFVLAEIVLQREDSCGRRRAVQQRNPREREQQEQPPRPGQQQQQQQPQRQEHQPRDWAALDQKQVLAVVAQCLIGRLVAAAGVSESQRMAAQVEDVHRRPSYVALRGPVFPALAWVPGALQAWLKTLLAQAMEMDGGVLPAIADVLTVPSAGALVLQCPSVRSAAALAAAARAAVPEGALGGGGGEVHLVLNAPEQNIAELLVQAAQEFCDSGQCSSGRDRLRLMVLFGVALNQLKRNMNERMNEFMLQRIPRKESPVPTGTRNMKLL